MKKGISIEIADQARNDICVLKERSVDCDYTSEIRRDNFEGDESPDI